MRAEIKRLVVRLEEDQFGLLFEALKRIETNTTLLGPPKDDCFPTVASAAREACGALGWGYAEENAAAVLPRAASELARQHWKLKAVVDEVLRYGPVDKYERISPPLAALLRLAQEAKTW